MTGLARIDLRLPDELVEKTDILAKLEYKNRTDVIKSALSEYLRRVETTMQLREKAVESYLDDKLTYNELAVAIGRQNAESVKVSKRLLLLCHITDKSTTGGGMTSNRFENNTNIKRPNGWLI